MKSLLTLFALFICTQAFSQQKLEQKNHYHRYYPKNLPGSQIKTFWLSETDIVPVIFEEMKNAGYDWLTGSLILKLDSGKYIVPACYSLNSKFGFLWEEIHGTFPNESNRYIKSLYKIQTGYDYAQKSIHQDGTTESIKIKSVPANLYILKADCYIYQQTDNPEDNKKLVTKAYILSVLRNDIRFVLKSAPPPSKK